MSKTIGKLENSGSRNVNMFATRYWGGNKNGVCIQLTARQDAHGALGLAVKSGLLFESFAY